MAGLSAGAIAVFGLMVIAMMLVFRLFLAEYDRAREYRDKYLKQLEKNGDLFRENIALLDKIDSGGGDGDEWKLT